MPGDSHASAVGKKVGKKGKGSETFPTLFPALVDAAAASGVYASGQAAAQQLAQAQLAAEQSAAAAEEADAALEAIEAAEVGLEVLAILAE